MTSRAHLADGPNRRSAGSARAARPARKAAEGLPERPNVAQVLQLIWRGEEVSRVEIARRLDLSRSTISGIVAPLLDTGLVAEVGSGESRGGRRPIVLRFQYDAYGILGIDMGATHISVAVTNLRGEVQAWEEQSHPVRTDPDGARKKVLELADACLSKWGKGAGKLIGVGIAVPSPVDPRHPERLSEVVLPAWKGEGVLGLLQQRFEVPVLVDNDANLGALAERWWGAGRGTDDFAYIKLGTGIGSGHIVGGRIYRGASGTAGEIGHLAIDSRGPPCVCGLTGCLCTFVGTQALVARASALLRSSPMSALARGPLTLRAIEDAALSRDPLALKVIRETADYLGIAVAGMLNLMNPAMVAVGGSVARVGELLLEPLRESVRSRTLVSSVAAAKIVAAELGARDVAVGAATLVLEASLEDLRYFPAAAGR